MTTQIKLRRDTAANWTANNTVVLAAGEAGFETDTGKLKIGNGTNTWASLDYVVDLSDVHTDIIPRTDNTYDLGSPDKQWRHVYTAGGSIYLDNIKLTNNSGKLEITKVINPGEENEEPDPEDSNAGDSVTSKLTNGSHEFKLESDGTLSLDGDPFTGGGGGGFTLPPNTTFDDLYEDGGATIGNNVGKINLYSNVSEGNDGVNIRVKGDGGDSEWNFKSDGSINLPDPGTIKNSNGAANLVATDYAQLQWTTQAGASNSIPNDTSEPKNWVYVESGGVYIETNLNAQVGNSQSWFFDNDGKLHLPQGGDIVDTDGISVLGGGTQTDQNIWITTIAGDDPQNENPVVCVSVEYDSDGNIIALFQHYPVNTGTNYNSVAKFTSTGTKLWQIRFAGNGSFNTDGWGIAVDNIAGSIFVSGQRGSETYTKTTVTKMSLSNGTIAWSKEYDFGYQSTSGVVDCDGDGDLVIVGYAQTGVDDQTTLVKIASGDGSILWAKALDGQGNEQAYGLAVGPNLEIVTVGFMDQLGVIDGAATLYAEPSSNPNWTVNQNGVFSGMNGLGIQFDVSFVDGVPTFSNIRDNVGSRTVDSIVATISGVSFGGTSPADDMVVKVGSLAPNDADDHMLVAKYDYSGNLVWQKAILFDTGFNCYGADADIDSQGNIYVCGQYGYDTGSGTTSAMNLVKFNSSGVAQWSRRVVGNCQTFATSVVVGPDDCLYLSGVTGNNPTSDYSFVIAKYNLDGTVAWQRLLDNTSTWTFAGGFFGPQGGGSNIAVKNGYVAIGGTFGDPGTQPYPMIAQFDSVGTVFNIDNWDFKTATFSGTLNGSASDITVANANKINRDIAGDITVTTFDLNTDTSNFLIPTIYRAGAATNELSIGEYAFTLNNDGSISLPTLTVNLHNGGDQSAQVLQLGNPNIQTVITGPTPAAGNSAERLIVQGQKATGNGEGGDVYVWGGDAQHDGGDIKIYAGDADSGTAGDNGGYVNISGGNGYSNGGDVTITGGYSANGAGGDITIRAGESGGTGTDGAVFIQTNGSSKQWSFDYTGILTLPDGGDIVNSNGSSVLGVQPGNPQTLNTVKGWFQLQGERPNDNDENAFQAITTYGNYIYTAGVNYLANTSWEDDSPVIQKIDKNTGQVVWSKRIVAGHDAQFNFEIVSGVVNVVGLPNAGVGYKAGEQLIIPGYWIGGSYPQGNVYVQVDTVDGTGAITGYVVSQQPQTPGSDGTYNNVGVFNNNNSVLPHSITYDLDGEQIIVACRTYRGAWSQEYPYDFAYINIYCLDDLNGTVNQTYTLKDLNDMEPTAVAAKNGQIAVVGQKYNEYRNFGPLTILSPGNGYFDILKSNLDPEHYPGSVLPGDEAYNFFIQGTGVAYQEGVDAVNQYQNLTTVTREGSGAVFDLVNNGNGTYGFSTIATAGTNYRVGHKIKILGTSLGGDTPANDAVITVNDIDGNGGIFSAAITGTAPGVVGASFNGVTGTNFEVGSGAKVTINVSPVTGAIYSIGTYDFGNYHYVVGDVLTVAGTNFANGTSPSNDITLTVTDLYFGGPNNYSVASGEVPNNALRIRVDGIDFTASGGEWTMRQTLAGEAFIWTPTWNQAIGSSNNDWFNGVTFSPDGNSIYAVGSGQYEVNYQQALVVKFAASNGAISWSKYVNSYLTPGSEVSAEAMNAVTLSNGNLVVSIGGQYNSEAGRDEHGLVCLDASGALQWATTYIEPNWGFNSQCQVSRDSSDNLYLVYVSNSGDGSDGWAILKIQGTDGSVIWSRAVSNGNNSMYFEYNWNKDYAVVNGNDIFIAGYTYIPNDDYYSALLVKFPTDGFKTFDDVGYEFGQQFGDLRVYALEVANFGQSQEPGTFTPTVHTGAVTTAVDEKAFTAIDDNNRPPVYLQYFTRDDLGYVEFGDGSKQSFATNIEPQILASYYQFLKLKPEDSGKHFFFDQNCAGRIQIPPYDQDGDQFPVGFKVTIVNCSGSNVYVEALQPNNGEPAEIWGSGRNTRTREWGIPDSGSGSMVTLMKVKHATYTGGENFNAPRWIISGPDDLYDSW